MTRTFEKAEMEDAKDPGHNVWGQSPHGYSNSGSHASNELSVPLERTPPMFFKHKGLDKRLFHGSTLQSRVQRN